jgi:hypothetical protein
MQSPTQEKKKIYVVGTNKFTGRMRSQATV